MCMQHVKSNAQTRLGLVFIVLASLSNFAARQVSSDSVPARDLVDLLTGLFYGLAIGLLLLSVWRRGRGDSTSACG